ncbi:hypothetical protein [Edwardsiella piscicida]|uniref:hypothetical protein n=1 Tax=Edwardsiella piscicida TaxID=1263550 RepID=UPI00370DB357
MTTITKKQALAVSDLKAGYTLGHADVSIMKELARIALAALEAEPVADLNRFTGRSFELEQQPGADKDPTVYIPPYTSSIAPVLPDGYVLVPIEPTEDMIVNGFESEPHEGFCAQEVWEEYQSMSGCQQAAHRAKLCWAAMIAAAPQQEASND